MSIFKIVKEKKLQCKKPVSFLGSPFENAVIHIFYFQLQLPSSYSLKCGMDICVNAQTLTYTRVPSR